jgi:hypothetical protein
VVRIESGGQFPSFQVSEVVTIRQRSFTGLRRKEVGLRERQVGTVTQDHESFVPVHVMQTNQLDSGRPDALRRTYRDAPPLCCFTRGPGSIGIYFFLVRT